MTTDNAVQDALALAYAQLKQQKRHDEMLRTVATSFWEFLPYWKFKDRETGQIKQFSHEELWPGQAAFARHTEQQKWILALKAGKLGFTELECAYDGWRLRFGSPNTRVHLFSKDARAATDLLTYVKFGLKNLPGWMQLPVIEGPGGDTTVSFKLANSTDGTDIREVVTYSAGPEVSIDQTAQHAHVDELARMAFGRLTWEAIASTVPEDGTCHIVSRGAGEDNVLATLWYGAVEGRNKFFPFFANWRSRPGRTDEWYHQEEEQYTRQGMRYFAPSTPQEALAGDEDSDYIPLPVWDMNYDSSLPVITEGNREPMIMAVDAAAGTKGGDHFGIVCTTRHPQRPDDPAIRMVRLWKPNVDGYLDFVPIEAWIREQAKILNILALAYDPYQLKDMMARLNSYISREEPGIETVQINQGGARLIADRRMYDLAIQRRLPHNGDPDLRDHIGNAKALLSREGDGSMRIVKRTPSKKIDLAVAASMGVTEILRRII